MKTGTVFGTSVNQRIKILGVTLAAALTFGLAAAPQAANAQGGPGTQPTPAVPGDNPGGPGLRGGRGLLGGRGGQGAMFVQVTQAVLEATAKATGLTEREVANELAGGKTLTDVITAKGANVDTVKAEAKAVLIADIDQAVKDGKLTEERATAMKDNLDNVLNAAFSGTLRELVRDRVGAGLRTLGVARVALTETADALKLTEADVVKALAGTETTLTQFITEKQGDVAAIKKAVKDVVTENVNSRVTEGKLTQENADKVIAGLDASIETVFTTALNLPNANGNNGGPVGRILNAGSVQVLIAEIAREANVTERDLLTDLRSGKTLSQIATEKGLDPAKIIAAATRTLTDQINAIVKRGRISQDDATKAIAQIPQVLTDAMNKANPLTSGPRR